MERCGESGREEQEVVGHKRLDTNTRITLSVVADPDSGFPAPLQSHGVGFENKKNEGDPKPPAKLRNQHGRGGRGPFR